MAQYLPFHRLLERNRTAPYAFGNKLSAKPDKFNGRTSLARTHIHEQGPHIKARKLFNRGTLMGIGLRGQLPVIA